MIDPVSAIVQFHGDPSIAISLLILAKYVCDLFFDLAVLVLVVPVLDVCLLYTSDAADD
mgnify:CR=1 FL=1